MAMRRRALPLLLLAGCVPIATPPVHARLGGGKSTPAHQETDDDGANVLVTGLGSVAVGLDTACALELPFDVELGIVSEFSNLGYYLEGGPLVRVGHFRFGATAGGEYWSYDHRGGGVKLGGVIEVASAYEAVTDTEYDNGGDDTGHDAPIITTTTRRAKAGTWAFGGYVDVGHRWLEDTPNYTYIVAGVSVRLAALAELVTIGAR